MNMETGEGLFPLRPVQVKALEMIKGSLRAGKRRPQLQLPTGSGKTIIAAHAMSGALDKGNRAAFVVPLLNLIDQTVERFVENGISLDKIGVVQADHPLKRPHAPIQVCSIQTLAKREFPLVEFVVIDESHICHKTTYEWMAEDEKKIFIGLSATPWAKGMAEHWQELLIPATIGDLIKAGDLCGYRAFAPTKPDLSDIKVTAGDYQVGQLSERMSEKVITADVVKTWLEKAEGRPTLLFAVDRAHAATLHDQFAAIGVQSAYVDAFTDREERAAVKKLFHKGEIKIVCSVGTMIAGIDWDVRCISFCRPTKSPILYVQAMGRGLRTAPGKDHLLILDHAGATLSLGLPADIHFDELQSGKRETGGGEAPKKKLPSPRECPECKEIVAATERHCRCGHVFKFASRVTAAEGELEEVGSSKQANANKHWTWEAKESFFGQLKWHAEVKGYKPGWAWHKYEDRFGVLPTAHRDAAPREPTYATLAWIWSTQIAWAKRQPKNR
jgi:superfamily II DNA or RNA helicase